MPLFRFLLPLVCLAAPSAHAATGDVSVVYGEALVADGQTAAQVVVYIEGSAPTDKVKIKAASGRTGSVERQPDGSFLVELVPPASEEAGELVLGVKSKGAFTGEATASVPLVPPMGGTLSLAFSAESVRAGSKAVTVTIRPEGPDHIDGSLRQLSLTASNGRLEAAKRQEDGTWTARWTPPSSVKAPEAVLFVATDLTAPSEVVGLATLPILTKRKVTFDAPQGSMNLVFTPEGQQGPLPANSKGKVSFTLDVHPARTTARLQTVLNTGERQDATVPLDTGARAQLTFARLPSGARVPAGRSMDFLLAVTERTGEPWNPAEDGTGPQLTVAGPGDPVIQNLGGGWYRVSAKAPTASGSWTLKASLGERSASQTVQVVKGFVELSLVPDPLSIAETTTAVKVTIRARDADGKNQSGRRLRVSASGAATSGSVADKGDGTYTQAFRLAKADEVHIGVRSAPSTGSLPLRRVRIWPGLGGQVADGERTFPVLVATEDAWGMPKSSVAVQLSVALGDATCPASATTGPDGLAVVTCTVGTHPGPVAVVGTHGPLVVSTVIQLVPVGGDIPEVVDLGSASLGEGLDRWQAAAPVLRLRRGEVVVLAAADVPMMQVEAPATGVSSSSSSGSRSAAGSGAVPSSTSGSAVVGVTATPMRWVDASKAPSGSSPVYQPDAPEDEPSQPAASSTAGSPPAMQAPPSSSSSKTGRSFLGSGGESAIPMVRARGGLAFLGQRYRATSDGPNAVLPSSAAFNANPITGGIGVFLSGEGWFLDGKVGADVRLRQNTYAAASIGESDRVGVGQGYLGAAYAALDLGPARVIAVGGYHRLNIDVVRYTDSLRDDTDLSNRPSNGLRLGGGLDALLGPAHARLEVGQTFAPLPVWTDLTLAVDVVVYEPLAVSAGYQLGYLYGTYEVGGEEVKARSLHNLFTLGASVTF